MEKGRKRGKQKERWRWKEKEKLKYNTLKRTKYSCKL